MTLYLDPHHNPRLKILINLTRWEPMDCMIDTGFSGGVALPGSFKKSFNPKPVAYQEYELADGSHKTYALYELLVRFDHHTKRVTAFFTNSMEGLVGIEFLTGYYLHLDLKRFTVKLE